MKRKYYLSFLACCSLALNVSFGQELVSYNSLQDPACSGINTFDPNVTAVGICRGPGIVLNTGLTYNSRDWTVTPVLDATDYLEWSLTPNVGYEIDLTSMDITYDRSATGPTMAEIQIDVGGGFVTLFTDNAVSVTGEDNNGIDLSAYTNITGTITFRLYAFNASSAAGTFDIEQNAPTYKGIIINGSVVPNCSLVTTWNGTWAPAAPDNSYNVIIDAPYNTATDGGSFDACSLTVNADLTIGGTDYVQVTHDITLNNGDINVASEANLVQIDDLSAMTLAGTGVGNLQKTTTILQALYSYTYWSSPVANELIGEPGSGMDLVPANRIFEYNAANFEDIAPADGFDDNSNDWAIASGPMLPGKGYAAFAQNNGFPFPQTQTYNFDGEFNNGIVTTLVTTSPGAGDPNWNLLGNPYPSGLNADLFLTDPANVGVIDGTLYLWTHNSTPLDTNPGPDDLNFSVDDYASYNILGGTAAVSGGPVPTNVVASAQGFFIEALANGVATFNNGMRVTSGNDGFYRTTDRIWLNLENDLGAFSQILVGFVEGGTDGVDRLYDGKRLDGGSLVSFFSLIDDEHYAIQGLGALTSEEIIPLGIMNLVEGVNEYKISIAQIEGLLESSEVFLKDNLLDITHDLNSGDYRFTSEQGSFTNRFELLLNTELVTTVEEEVLMINKNLDDTLTFKVTGLADIQNIQLFDMLGRQLYNKDFSDDELPDGIRFDQLKQTIFIAKVTLSNGKVLTKKGLK